MIKCVLYNSDRLRGGEGGGGGGGGAETNGPLIQKKGEEENIEAELQKNKDEAR